MASEARRVTVVGGGLAGLALSLALRQRGVPVELFEAGRYPRHRVCGEFMAGRGWEVLRELGLESRLSRLGVSWGNSTAWFLGSRPAGRWNLPEPAACLARSDLDAVMAEQLVQQGGVVHQGIRWAEDPGAAGVVRATGRIPRAGKQGVRWLGLKAHATGVELDADLEMHVVRDGYVGLCRLGGGRVNVCGLFRGQAGARAAGGDLASRVAAARDTALGRRLRGVRWVDGTACAVAGLSYAGPSGAGHGGCAVGDAVSLIPPVSGNGMSLALESGVMAAGPLELWSQGRLGWSETCDRVRRDWAERFAARVRWAGRVQTVLFRPRVCAVAAVAGPLLPVLFRWLYARTH